MLAELTMVSINGEGKDDRVVRVIVACMGGNTWYTKGSSFIGQNMSNLDQIGEGGDSLTFMTE